MANAKAWAGGITAALTTVLMYFLDMIPVMVEMPDNVHSAMEFIVSFTLTAAIVYLVPNTPKESP